jgi:ribosomal protein S6
MAKKISSSGAQVSAVAADTASDERRVYELGYLAVSTLTEAQLSAAVASVRSAIEGKGGSIISEDAPKDLVLAYTMYTRSQEKNIPHEKAFFGSLKFEGSPESAEPIRSFVAGNNAFIRSILYTTVAEDTRAKIAPEKLKEVRATGTITKAAKKEKSEISESELDKTVDSIVADII